MRSTDSQSGADGLARDGFLNFKGTTEGNIDAFVVVIFPTTFGFMVVSNQPYFPYVFSRDTQFAKYVFRVIGAVLRAE